MPRSSPSTAEADSGLPSSHSCGGGECFSMRLSFVHCRHVTVELESLESVPARAGEGPLANEAGARASGLRYAAPTPRPHLLQAGQRQQGGRRQLLEPVSIEVKLLQPPPAGEVGGEAGDGVVCQGQLGQRLRGRRAAGRGRRMGRRVTGEREGNGGGRGMGERKRAAGASGRVKAPEPRQARRAARAPAGPAAPGGASARRAPS
jgi:hypothetical protein